jgi:hypothetical protein
MYRVKDVVECGYFDNQEKGGTIDVELSFDKFDSEVINKCLKIIDYFDHCVITDDKEVAEFSERYFLIDKKINFLEDIARCLKSTLVDEQILITNIKITLGKVSYESHPNQLPNNVIEYSVKG